MDIIYEGIGIVSFIACIALFVMAYRNKKKKVEFKKQLIGGLVTFALAGIMVGLYSQNSVQKIIVKDITVTKGKTAKLMITTEPKDANNRADIKCKVDDTTVVSLDGEKIKGIKDGNASYTCSLDDIKSNKAIITVELSKEEKEKIAAEKAAAEKAAKEKAEKKKKEEAKKKEESKNKLSSFEEVEVKDNCKTLVEQVLKAPSTAKFPGSTFNPLKGWQMAKKNNVITVHSYVDAQNGFGAMIRTEFWVKFKVTDAGYTATYFKFGDQVVINGE